MISLLSCSLFATGEETDWYPKFLDLILINLMIVMISLITMMMMMVMMVMMMIMVVVVMKKTLMVTMTLMTMMTLMMIIQRCTMTTDCPTTIGYRLKYSSPYLTDHGSSSSPSRTEPIGSPSLSFQSPDLTDYRTKYPPPDLRFLVANQIWV